MGGQGMEMCRCHCRAGKDGDPFWRRAPMATEVLHAINVPWEAHLEPCGLQIFCRTKVVF